MSGFKTLALLGVRPLPLPDKANTEYISLDINWADAGAGIAVADVIQLCEIPENVEVVDWRLFSDDIDSNGAPTVAFTLGFLNAAKTAMGAGTYDTFTAVGGITVGQTGGVAQPSGATGANHILAGRGTKRTLGLLATAITATPALAGKKAVLELGLRSGSF